MWPPFLASDTLRATMLYAEKYDVETKHFLS